MTSRRSRKLTRVACWCTAVALSAACGDRTSPVSDATTSDLVDATLTRDGALMTATTDADSSRDEDVNDTFTIDAGGSDATSDGSMDGEFALDADASSVEDAWTADPDASSAPPRDPVCERRLSCLDEEDRCSLPIASPTVATCARWLHTTDRTGAMYRAITPLAPLRVTPPRPWFFSGRSVGVALWVKLRTLRDSQTIANFAAPATPRRRVGLVTSGSTLWLETGTTSTPLGELRAGQWHLVSFSTDGTQWSATLDAAIRGARELTYTDLSELDSTLVIGESASRAGSETADISVDDLHIFEAPAHFATVVNLRDPMTAHAAHTLASQLEVWLPFDGTLDAETQRCASPSPAAPTRMPTRGTISDRFDRSFRASSFDGTGRSTLMAGAFNTAPNSARTLSVWARSRTGTLATMVNAWTVNDRFSLRLNGGHAELVTNAFSVLDAATINDDRWHHVVGSYDGVSLKLWVDQRLAGSVGGVNLANEERGSLSVGDVSSYAPGDHEPFIGELDDARAYSAALSPDTIERHRTVQWSHSTDATSVAPAARSLESGLASELETNAAGESFVVHTFSRALGLDGRAHTISGDGSAVSKFSAHGAKRWTTTLASSVADGSVIVRRIVAVGDDIVVAATARRGNFLVNGTSVATLNASDTPVLLRLSGTDGRLRWWNVFSAGASAELRGLSTLDGATLVAGGSFEGTHEFGAHTVTSAGASDVFVLRFDADTGEVLAAFRAGNTADERLVALSATSVDRVAIVGTYAAGRSNLGGALFADPGLHRWGFVARLGIDGTHQFSTALTATGDVRPFDVRSRSGSYVIAGEFTQTLSLLGRTHNGNPTGRTPFITSFDAATDALAWTSVIEDSETIAFAPRIAVDSNRVSLLLRSPSLNTSVPCRISGIAIAAPGQLAIVDLARSTGQVLRSEVVAAPRTATPNALALFSDGTRLLKIDTPERVSIDGVNLGHGVGGELVLRLVY